MFILFLRTGKKYSNRIKKYKNININLLPRLNSIDFLKTLLNSKVVISIPKSDSSPRSVYEAINLGCSIFVTKLECLEWIPSRLKSEFMYSTNNLRKDSLNLINLIDNFKRRDFDMSFKEIFPDFYNALDYKKNCKHLFGIIRKIQNG